MVNAKQRNDRDGFLKAETKPLRGLFSIMTIHQTAFDHLRNTTKVCDIPLTADSQKQMRNLI